MTLQANLDSRKGHQEKEVKELKVTAEKMLKERTDLEEKISEMETMKVITDNRYNRPLSRRLDRCDRMIQNEGNDSRKLFTLKIALCR